VISFEAGSGKRFEVVNIHFAETWRRRTGFVEVLKRQLRQATADSRKTSLSHLRLEFRHCRRVAEPAERDVAGSVTNNRRSFGKQALIRWPCKLRDMGTAAEEFDDVT